jgi:hypothetical protein
VSEPKRWLDDPNAPAELRELLQRAPRGRALDGATRARLGSRVARYAAIPLSAAAWLSVKSAAALGVAAGVATASVVAVVERTVLAPEPPPAATTPPKAPAAARTAAERPLSPSPSPPASVESAPAATVPAPPVAPRTPIPSAAWPVEGGLAEETALLEKARRALGPAPASALELTREHAQRFAKPELRAERNLIEIEALYRVGRRDQARSLAERLLAGSADDLYAERVRRLLGKIERGE